MLQEHSSAWGGRSPISLPHRLMHTLHSSVPSRVLNRESSALLIDGVLLLLLLLYYHHHAVTCTPGLKLAVWSTIGVWVCSCRWNDLHQSAYVVMCERCYMWCVSSHMDMSENWPNIMPGLDLAARPNVTSLGLKDFPRGRRDVTNIFKNVSCRSSGDVHSRPPLES